MTKPTETYLDDYHNRPQYKFHAQLDLGKEWTVWARFTNSGNTEMVGQATTELMNKGQSNATSRAR